MTKKNFYPQPIQNIDFAKIEAEILKFWQENKIFEKSIEIRDFISDNDDTSPVVNTCSLNSHTNCRHEESDGSEFVFYDGPPFANGLPHYGHLLTGFIKDIFARYQTMKGKKVERKFGWDTHGLPVEMETEKELGVSGQVDIEKYGIDKFNNSCEISVMKYASEWKDYVTRQGRWVDFDNGYKTMDINYMESVLWAFKELHNKGLLYEDFRVMPYSWACQTPVSNFETRMDNAYRQKESPAVTVSFKLKKPCKDNFIQAIDNNLINEINDVKLVAWTTTPWTLPSNLALAVGAEIKYVAIKFNKDIYVIAESLSDKFIKDNNVKDFEIYSKIKVDATRQDCITSITGKLLADSYHSYEPLFPYFSSDDIYKNPRGNKFKVFCGDFVTTEDGTGIVHMAPGFGEDDQILCKAMGIPTICPVDEGGRFTNEIFDLDYPDKSNSLKLKGRNVLGFDSKLNYDKENNPNKDIIKYLKATGAWIKTEQYLHNYPHCWRTDTPLIYRAVSSWYVEVTKIRDKMVELNQTINWIPKHIRDGQFGKWLEGARDWSISRNRFWGCPVPVWRSTDPLYPRIDVYGSLDDLERDFKVRPKNLHRPFIDELTRLNPSDPRSDKNHPEHQSCSKMERVSDVLDCWFESGSMPYAQVHYPFENKEWFDNNFPADFITEYVAQTRGWFYTLMVLSTALFERAPFKNVICHGTILDENSQKLSKRLKNYADPIDVFNNTGSDAMRFYMISQPVMRGQELRVDKDGKSFKETLRLSIKPIFNAYNFFCLYANSDSIKAQEIDGHRKFNNSLDLYILSKLKNSVSKIDISLRNFDTIEACDEFNKFFEVLNNFYIRRSRQRFWNSEIDQDKIDAYDVLYTSLITMSKAAAPLLPFTCEFLWMGLNGLKT